MNSRRVEVEPRPGRRQADDHATCRRSASRGARSRSSPGRRPRRSAIVDALRRDLLRAPSRARPGRPRASRRAAAPARAAPRAGSTQTIVAAPAIRAPCTTNWPDTAGAHDEHGRARLDARREQHRADTGQRRAAEQRRLLSGTPSPVGSATRSRDDDPLRERSRSPFPGRPSRRRATSPSCRRRASRRRSRGAAARTPRAVPRRQSAHDAARRRPREHDLVARRETARRRRRPPRRPRRPRGRAPSASAAATRPSTWCRSVPQIPTAAIADDDLVRAWLVEVDLGDLERLADRRGTAPPASSTTAERALHRGARPSRSRRSGARS